MGAVIGSGAEGLVGKFGLIVGAVNQPVFIRLFMKLPAKFKVPTPVGDYNPDWAIIKQADDENRIYMIRETKSTHDPGKRRPSENAKIDAAIEHFKAIGIGYDVTVPPPPAWNL